MEFGARTQADRLRDGHFALQHTKIDPKTKSECDSLITILWNGALALQSLDDLGSKEANDQAWEDMQVLDKRRLELNKLLMVFENKS